jgi:hypothetical protein
MENTKSVATKSDTAMTLNLLMPAFLTWNIHPPRFSISFWQWGQIWSVYIIVEEEKSIWRWRLFSGCGVKGESLQRGSGWAILFALALARTTQSTKVYVSFDVCMSFRPCHNP